MLTNNYTHEQDINNYKDWSSIHSFTSKMNVFDDYLETTDVCLCEYTTTDKWEKCFEDMPMSTNNISSIKSRIRRFLLDYDYPREVISALETSKKSGGTNYFLNIQQIQDDFDDYREKKIGMSIFNSYGVDVLSSVELSVYLLWFGFKIPEILQIKRSDFNWSTNVIYSAGKSVKIPAIVKKRFEIYCNASGYWHDDNRVMKLAWVEFERESNLFLCKGKGTYKEQSLIKQINRAGFSIQHLWWSRRFHSVWEKVQILGYDSIDWDSTNDVELFFDFGKEYSVSSTLQKMVLKYDWERYCFQQNEYTKDKTNVSNKKRRFRKYINK